jgi:hypothetical protein
MGESPGNPSGLRETPPPFFKERQNQFAQEAGGLVAPSGFTVL